MPVTFETDANGRVKAQGSYSDAPPSAAGFSPSPKPKAKPKPKKNWFQRALNHAQYEGSLIRRNPLKWVDRALGNIPSKINPVNDIRYEVEQWRQGRGLRRLPAYAAPLVGGPSGVVQNWAQSKARPQVVSAAADSLKNGIEAYQFIRGQRMDYTRSPLGEFLDEWEDIEYRTRGWTPRQQQEGMERLVTDMGAELAATGVVGQAGSVMLTRMMARGGRSAALAKSILRRIDPTAPGLSLAGRTARASLAGALEEVFTLPFVDNSGNAATLVNSLAGTEVVPDLYDPSMNRVMAGVAGGYNNVIGGATLPLIGGAATGLFRSIARARRGVAETAPLKEARSKLENAGILEKDEETGAYRRPAQPQEAPQEPALPTNWKDAEREFAQRNNIPLEDPNRAPAPEAPATAGGEVGAAMEGVGRGITEGLTESLWEGYQGTGAMRDDPIIKLAQRIDQELKADGIDLPFKKDELGDFARAFSAVDGVDAKLDLIHRWYQKKGGKRPRNAGPAAGAPAAPEAPAAEAPPADTFPPEYLPEMLPREDVTALATTRAPERQAEGPTLPAKRSAEIGPDEALDQDPWTIENPDAVPADVGLNLVEDLDDDQLAAVYADPTRPAVEQAEELLAERGAAPINEGYTLDRVSLPRDAVAGDFLERYPDRLAGTPYDALRDVVVNTPELAAKGTALFGKPVPQLTKKELVKTILSMEDRVVLTNRLRGVAMADVFEINVRPDVYQFKQGVNETGEQIGQSLANTERWDPDAEGIIQVWRNPETGSIDVVNGHNRLALAKRLGLNTVRVEFLDAFDPADARRQGAIANISSGGGTVWDAAKFIRETPEITDLASLKAAGKPTRSGFWKQGLALSKLPDDLFKAAQDGLIDTKHAVWIGESGLDPEKMSKLFRVASEGPSDAVMRARIEIARTAPKGEVSQPDLLGNTEVDLSDEKARLYETVRKELSANKNLFGRVSKNARTLRERTDTQVDVRGSIAVSEEARNALRFFDQQWMYSGPVGDLLNQGARDLNQGASIASVTDEIVQKLPALLEEQMTSMPQRAPQGPDTPLLNQEPAEEAGTPLLGQQPELEDTPGGVPDPAVDPALAQEWESWAPDMQDAQARAAERVMSDPAAGPDAKDDARIFLTWYDERITQRELPQPSREAMALEIVRRELDEGRMSPPQVEVPDVPASDVEIDVVAREIASGEPGDLTEKALGEEMRLRQEFEAQDNTVNAAVVDGQRQATGWYDTPYEDKKGEIVQGYDDPPPDMPTLSESVQSIARSGVSMGRMAAEAPEGSLTRRFGELGRDMAMRDAARLGELDAELTEIKLGRRLNEVAPEGTPQVGPGAAQLVDAEGNPQNLSFERRGLSWSQANTSSVPELKALLKERGVKGYSGKSKAQLVQMVKESQGGEWFTSKLQKEAQALAAADRATEVQGPRYQPTKAESEALRKYISEEEVDALRAGRMSIEDANDLLYRIEDTPGTLRRVRKKLLAAIEKAEKVQAQSGAPSYKTRAGIFKAIGMPEGSEYLPAGDIAKATSPDFIRKRIDALVRLQEGGGPLAGSHLGEEIRSDLDRALYLAGGDPRQPSAPGRPEFLLSRDLAQSDPRYGMATLRFQSDLDRAAYILASDKRTKASKAAPKFRAELEAAGLDPDMVARHGNRVRMAISDAIQEQTGSRRAPTSPMELVLDEVPWSEGGEVLLNRKRNTAMNRMRELARQAGAIDATAPGAIAELQRIQREMREARLDLAEEELKGQVRTRAREEAKVWQLVVRRRNLKRLEQTMTEELLTGLEDALRISGISPEGISTVAKYNPLDSGMSVEDAARAIEFHDPDAPEAMLLKERGRSPLIDRVMDQTGGGYYPPRAAGGPYSDAMLISVRAVIDERFERGADVFGRGRAKRYRELFQTYYHEAFHAVQVLLKPAERNLLTTDGARTYMRRLLKEEGVPIPADDLELQAEAFAVWSARMSRRRKELGSNNPVVRAFSKIRLFVGSLMDHFRDLSGMSAKVEELFIDAWKGEYGAARMRMYGLDDADILDAMSSLDSVTNGIRPEFTRLVREEFVRRKKAMEDELAKMMKEATTRGCT